MGNIVAIVGRPNVGKSTLFNRLTHSRRAIVNDEAGTTRDRQYGKSEWEGREFSVIDTGGWVINSSDVFEGEIKRHVVLAIEEADVILFLVDVQNGITDYDLEVAQILRGHTKPVMLVSNKGQMIRINVGGISEQGRNTQGVRLMTMSQGEKVVACETMAEVAVADVEPPVGSNGSGNA